MSEKIRRAPRERNRRFGGVDQIQLWQSLKARMAAYALRLMQREARTA